jgi:hypothetical protein
MGAWFVLLLAQTASTSAAAQQASEPPVPLWGWITIVTTLAGTVGTLGGLYKKARDREVEAERSKVELVQNLTKQTSSLLERAIEAFTTNKLGTEQVVEKLKEVLQEQRALREDLQEVRRGEKGSR